MSGLGVALEMSGLFNILLLLALMGERKDRKHWQMLYWTSVEANGAQETE